MNGSRVRGGEGRFITFVFFFEDKKGDSIENNKIKGYKSTLTTPHPGPISYNKKITGNLKNSIIAYYQLNFRRTKISSFPHSFE